MQECYCLLFFPSKNISLILLQHADGGPWWLRWNPQPGLICAHCPLTLLGAIRAGSRCAAGPISLRQCTRLIELDGEEPGATSETEVRPRSISGQVDVKVSTLGAPGCVMPSFCASQMPRCLMTASVEGVDPLSSELTVWLSLFACSPSGVPSTCCALTGR